MSGTPIEAPLDVLRSRVGVALGEPVSELRRLPGGASGLTYLARVGHVDHPVVVKVAPAGIPAVGNRDVLRQAQVLHALAGVDGVRVPAVLAEDPGAGDEVPPFFVMSFVAGESVEPLQEPGWTTHRADMGRRALAAVEMLAAMHRAPAIPSEAPVDLHAEVARWDRAFASAPEELRVGHESCRDNLLADLPAPMPPVIVHGDWRLGNMVASGPRIAAVIDWEIWAVGDPRGDLSWLLLAMDPEHPHASVASDGLPGPDAMLTAYEDVRGSVADLQWFAALQRYKQAAILALLVKNARKADPAHPFAVTFRPVIHRLLEWSARIASSPR